MFPYAQLVAAVVEELVLELLPDNLPQVAKHVKHFPKRKYATFKLVQLIALSPVGELGPVGASLIVFSLVVSHVVVESPKELGQYFHNPALVVKHVQTQLKS